jgi:hypothetical protein
MTPPSYLGHAATTWFRSNPTRAAASRTTAIDHIPGERGHLALGPSGKTPDHQLAYLRFREAPFAVGGVEAARDVRPRPGIGETVVASISPDRLEGGGLDPPVLQEGVEKVVADVAAPEGPVRVRRDDPVRLGAGRLRDARPHLVGGLLLHGGSITDRLRPSLD